MTGDNWTLQVKSLEQETQSVTVPSDASVLQLKDAIQPVFDIASERQRLIFQGKVLKDGKQLAEYANLKDGMIIHLVARPIDAPSNPSNDDPQTNTSNTSRGQASNRFPGILRPPEGYTFITIDANIGSLGGDNNNPDIGGILQNLFNGSLGRRNTQNTSTLNGQSDNNNNTQNTPMTSNRNRTRSSNLVNFDFNFNMEPTANTSLLENTLGYASALPPLELRLTRALAAIANIQTSLNGDLSDSDANAFTWSNISNASPEQNQTFRSRLRASGTSETAQIGMVLEELANVMESMTPRLRQLAQEAQSNTEQTDSEGRSETTTLQFRRMSRIIQNFSMLNHFLGNLMIRMDDRRSSRPSRNSPLGGDSVRRRTTAFTYAPGNNNNRRRRQPPIENQTTTTANVSADTSKSNETSSRSKRDIPSLSSASTSTTGEKRSADDNHQGDDDQEGSSSSTTGKNGKGKRRC